jgi:hypothetical protein
MENQRLVDDLLVARESLLGELEAVSPESMTTPGLLGEWSARELIAHLGYWAGYAVEIIHAAEEGRLEELGIDEPSVDQVNDTVARVARETDLATVRKREAASVEVLVERLRALDPSLLTQRLPEGDSLEEGINENGAAHYREHADELRATLREQPRG